MFTGIVQELGTVTDKEETKAGVRLIVHAAEPFLKDLELSLIHISEPTRP